MLLFLIKLIKKKELILVMLTILEDPPISVASLRLR
jgi:hypothetical protein